MTKEERREYDRKYREEHREQLNAYARKRYLRPDVYERIRERQRLRYQRKKEEAKK